MAKDKIEVKSPIGQPKSYDYDVEDFEWLRDKLGISKKEMARILGKSRVWYQNLCDGRWESIDAEAVDRLYTYCAKRGFKLKNHELPDTPLADPPAPRVDPIASVVDLRTTGDVQPSEPSQIDPLKRKRGRPRKGLSYKDAQRQRILQGIKEAQEAKEKLSQNP